MKRIINGKRYDTSSAKKLAEACSKSYSRRDFGFWEEELYLTKSGNYFLHGVGGPASKYAEACGQNNWTGGEKIIPISEEAAKVWAEEHIDGDEYESIFGEVEMEDRAKISADIPVSIKEKLDEIKGNKSYGEIISELVLTEGKQ